MTTTVSTTRTGMKIARQRLRPPKKLALAGRFDGRGSPRSSRRGRREPDGPPPTERPDPVAAGRGTVPPGVRGVEPDAVRPALRVGLGTAWRPSVGRASPAWRVVSREPVDVRRAP